MSKNLIKNSFISNNTLINEGINGLLNLIEKHPNRKMPFFSEQLATSVKNSERWIKKLKKRGGAK